MKRLALAFLIFVLFTPLSAQQDSIKIAAELQPVSGQMLVRQEIIYHNKTQRAQEKIKLLNWIAAYKNRNTALLKRTLQNRKNELYFAKNDQLGKTTKLNIKTNAQDWQNFEANAENIYIPLTQTLAPGESIKISLNYTLEFPDQKFTGYGINKKNIALKYFFIVPDGFESELQEEKFFKNIEENQSPNNYWQVQFVIPEPYKVLSNLDQVGNLQFEGQLHKDVEFLLTTVKSDHIQTKIGDQTIQISFGYELENTEKEYLEFYLPLQLHFIKNKIGWLPDHLFISNKFLHDENFIGISDIHFWKFHYQLFSDAEKTDLTYFSVISKAVMQRAATFNTNEDHWLINGLKTYLEIQYLQRYYGDRKLLGDLPENLKFFGVKPLKFFHLSQLKLTERYGLAYQYIMTQNLDQKIKEPFEKLSNFNANAISHFETGSLFSFVAEKMGSEKFDDFLITFLNKQSNIPIDSQQFLDELAVVSGYSSDFLSTFIEHKNRVNFNLKRYRKVGDNFHVKIDKNAANTIPFKIQTEKQNGQTDIFWFDTDQKKGTTEYIIPQSNAEKLVINSDYIFPENNFRDNYLYTKGLFANSKKIKIKLFKDIPNPEYNEIYLNPRLNFNAYDKVLLGLNFKNASLFSRKFNYSITPYFSSGTGKMTGSGAVGYDFQPAESFYRSLDIGVSGSYFHYDYDLKYRKMSAYAAINFTKDPRSDIGRNLIFSYQYFNKDKNPAKPDDTEYLNYNLWNVGYSYADRRLIHEQYINSHLQWMEDFQKISAEFFYRWEFAEDKKISFRFFGGYFLKNQAKNELFNFGISRVSNYAFSYGLIGQSATSGVLAQQLIIAEGGFKSYLGTTANQWLMSTNLDAHVWRWFNIYADAGVFKRKMMQPQFIWDSGVKVKVIPDFLEIYFPIQSSLGFEPAFSDYGKRIRFTLSLNFSAITSYFRRGWF